MENTSNSVLLCGELQDKPQFTHENRGRRYFRFSLEVPRLSGTVDTLPVVASEALLETLDLSGGGMLRVSGTLRSHNVHCDGTRRLLVFLYASCLEACDAPPENQVHLVGTVCKPPSFRKTPLGREICDMMLAVSRQYQRSDYLPCILWGRTARSLADCQTGSRIALDGRLQSRDYIKQTETGPLHRRTYEVSALSASHAPPLEP